MILRRYRGLWAHRPVRVPFVATQVARLCTPMLTLALTLYVVGSDAGYGRAGAAAGLMTVGSGATVWFVGRMADRIGRAPVLLCCAASTVVGAALLLAVPVRSPGFLPLCLLAGAAAPPINSVARSLWRDLTSGEDLAGVYGADATLQQVVYIVGPLVVTGLVAVGNPRLALVGAAALGVIGSVAFAFAPAVRHAGRAVPEPGGTVRLVAVLWQPLVAGVVLVIGLSMVQINLVAAADRAGDAKLSGLLVSVWMAGSALGGVLLGAWAGRSERWLPAMLAVVAAGFAVLAVPVGLIVLGVLLVVGGFAISPTMAALLAAVGRLAPQGRAAEAFSWMAIAFLVGGATGAVLAGTVADAAGPGAAFLVAGAATLTGVLASRPRSAPEQPTSRGAEGQAAEAAEAAVAEPAALAEKVSVDTVR